MSGGACLRSVGIGAVGRQASRSQEQSVSIRENNLVHAQARGSLTKKICTAWNKTRRRTGGRDTDFNTKAEQFALLSDHQEMSHINHRIGIGWVTNISFLFLAISGGRYTSLILLLA